MSRGIRPWCASVLAAGLSTGCGLFTDSQTPSLDLAELEDGEGYVVGTITSEELYTEDGVERRIEAPDIDYTILVGEAQTADSLGAAIVAILTPSASWRIGVTGEESPALFALKLPAGAYSFNSLEMPYGGQTLSMPIGLDFDVTPGVVTYVGDVRLQFVTALGLFGVHYHKHLLSSASDDRALLDTLLPSRFPGAHPQLTPAVARVINF